ncbi:hypothetical protein IWQ60_010075 [Tieghemiomyces parasiticus]|uniref:Uncharacterized protein n=1 Tax=Tieghemiomyces parasiticus TaxID=78921 RepID=A0A9W7ZRC3_9FUNG|nr:hypothetical protein IWQ60_010075 [Tieghemiomyces parasiticus]
MVYVNRVLNLDDPNLGRRPIQSYVNAYDMNEEYLMRHMEGRRVTAFLRQDPELMTCLFWGMIHYSDHVMDIEDLEYYVIEQLAVVRGANIRERYIRSVGVPQTMASSPEVIHPTTSETSESRDALPSIRMNFNPTTFEMEARAAWTRLQETRPNVHDERLRIALILWDANRDIITGRNELAPSDPYGIYMT